MMKIATIAWKDTLVRFASRSEWLFFLILPVFFTFVVTQFAGQASGGDNRIPLLVIDADGSALAGEVLAELEQSDAVRPLVLPPAEARAAFDERDAAALLTIPAGFETAVLAAQPVEVEILVDASNTNSLAAEQAVRAASGRVGAALATANNSVLEAERLSPFQDDAARLAYFGESLAMARELHEKAPVRVEVTQPPAAPEDDYDPAAQTSAGQLVIWVFIPLLGTSALFAYERSNGTLRRLLITPTGRSTYLLGTITGQFALGLVQMILLVGFGVLVMDVNWARAPVALAVILVTFGLASVAMGTMLGTFVRTGSQANGLSIMLGMTMGLLGGCMWPLELFPPAIRAAVHGLPTTWAMSAMSDMLMRGQGLAGIWPNAVVLLGFAVVFFGVGVWRFRYE